MPCQLSSFPFLSPEEFQSISSSFTDHVKAYTGDLSLLGWTNIQHKQQNGNALLIISRIIHIPLSEPTNRKQTDDECSLQEEDLIEDDDPEMLIRPSASSASSKVEVEYNILLSPVYQVPVLYFFLRGSPYTGSNALEIIYHHLVSPAYRSDLKQVGVMGGVSMTNHPISGIPVYFIHPCNTASALRDVAGNVTPTPETYLLLWLGLIGNCVGLHMPKELLASTNESFDIMAEQTSRAPVSND